MKPWQHCLILHKHCRNAIQVAILLVKQVKNSWIPTLYLSLLLSNPRRRAGLEKITTWFITPPLPTIPAMLRSWPVKSNSLENRSGYNSTSKRLWYSQCGKAKIGITALLATNRRSSSSTGVPIPVMRTRFKKWRTADSKRSFSDAESAA